MLEGNKSLSLGISRPLWPFLLPLSPPPQKLTIPNLAANFSWSLFPQNYFQEVLVDICRGINKPQRPLGGIVLMDFHSPLCFLEEECPFVLHLTPAGYQAGCWRSFTDFKRGEKKHDRFPPGVFTFEREVYKCNLSFNFRQVTSEE